MKKLFLKKFTLVFGLLLVVFLFTAGVNAQTKSSKKTPEFKEINPEKVGFSKQRLERIDKMLKEAVDSEEIPGAVALIIKDGKIVFYEAYGKSDARQRRKYKTDDIFRIASQTKAITSTAVMMLWEEGKLRLDDPVEKYIPEFADAEILASFNDADSTYTSVPSKSKLTIRQLLTHTSGIGYGFLDGDERIKKIYAKAEIIDGFTAEKALLSENIKKLADLPLLFEPGSKYKYSESIDVLGYLVEVLSGMPLDEYFKQHIFRPLEMEDTWFYLPGSKSRRLVGVLEKDSTGWKDYIHWAYDIDYPKQGAKTYFSGGAGLSSTVLDYAKFLQMYLNEGEYKGTRLLSRKTVEFILQNQIGDLFPDKNKGFGLGFALVNKQGAVKGGEGSCGTFDWGGYYNTQYFADPKENVIGILYKQTLNVKNDDTGWKFRQMVFQSIDN